MSLALLFVSLCFVAPSSATSAPRGPLAYEQWHPPLAAHPKERDILAACRAAYAPRSTNLQRDARLTTSARALLPWAKGHVGESLPMHLVVEAARHHGITDGELSAVAIATDNESLASLAAREVHSLFKDNRDLNRIGVALQREHDDEHSLLVLLASRRLVHLAPLPRLWPEGHFVSVSGTVLDPFVQSVRLYSAIGDEVSETTHLPLRRGHFYGALPRPPHDGVADMQLLVERGHGPEVAAEFSLRYGEKKGAAHDKEKSGAPPAHAHRDLMTLISGFREAHGLAVPLPSPVLMQVAQAHADDMAAHHFFAHVSPTQGSASRRLRARGVKYERVVENLALASDAEVAFADWHHSPSHLANLLDTRVESIGLGAAPSPNAPDEWLFVLLMARLPGLAR